MAGRIKLGELLVRAGVLDDFKLKAALAEQQRWGGRLGRILVEMNFVSEDLLVRALSKQLGVPRARLERVEIPGEILSRIDPQFAQANSLCPERYLADKKCLVIAMSDPTNVSAIDELRFKTGLRIETSLGGELEITQAIDRVFYGRAPIDGIEMGADPGGASALAKDVRIPAEAVGQMASPPAQNGWAVAVGSSAPPRARPMAPAPGPPPGSFPAPPSFAGRGGAGHPNAPHPPAGFAQPGAQASGGAALEMAVALDASQRRQLKAIRVMLELLIEKGVFSRDEYMALVNRR